MASKLLILSVCLLFVFAATFEASRLNSKAKCGGYGAPIDVTLENYKEKVVEHTLMLGRLFFYSNKVLFDVTRNNQFVFFLSKVNFHAGPWQFGSVVWQNWRCCSHLQYEQSTLSEILLFPGEVSSMAS